MAAGMKESLMVTRWLRGQGASLEELGNATLGGVGRRCWAMCDVIGAQLLHVESCVLGRSQHTSFPQ